MAVTTEKNKGRPSIIPFALAAVVALLIATTQIKRYLPVSAVAFYHDHTVVDVKNGASLVNPELTAHAVGCLRLSKPDIPDDSIQYPSDAFAHYQDIHLRLYEWTQKEGHVPHGVGNFKGPWIENRFISSFQSGILDAASLAWNFGAYIPLFVPWTDIYVKSEWSYPPSLIQILQSALRHDVLYIIVNQNDDGFPGRCTELIELQERYHITTISSGGWGHVAMPLLKQEEEIGDKQPISEREHVFSFVGNIKSAPYSLRQRAIDEEQVFHYHGGDWQTVMRSSKFSLAPRGYGRTSYRLSEVMQQGLIPIEIYQDGDESWTPYGSMLNDYVYVVSIDGLHELIEELKNKSDAEISVMESKIESLRKDYFTYGGILEQIRLFLTEPSRSALTCRKLPQTSGTPDSIRWPRGHQCIKTST